MEWMILPLRRYADFSGRSRRMEFWMFALFNILVSIAFTIIAIALGGTGSILNAQEQGDGAVFGWLLGGWGILLLIWGLATLIPNIAVSVRRLHDRDMSGWWYLGVVIGSMIPFLGFLVAVAYLVLMALPGTPGPNRFGPDPKGTDLPETFA